MKYIIRIDGNEVRGNKMVHVLYNFVHLETGIFTDTWHDEPYWPVRIGRKGSGGWTYYSKSKGIVLYETYDTPDNPLDIVLDLDWVKRYPLRQGDGGRGELRVSRPPKRKKWGNIDWKVVEVR